MVTLATELSAPGQASDLDAPPAGALVETRYVRVGQAGPRIFMRRWRRIEGERGLIVLVPGFSDHGGRYPHLVRAAIAEGYGLLAMDTRGHGLSEGQRGHVRRFEDYSLDLDRVLRDVDGPRRSAPVALWAHSMGAVIALSYLSAGLGRDRGIGAVVLSAPALRVVVRVPRWKELLARFLNKRAPRIPFQSEIDPDALSRDLEAGRRYLQDPLAHHTCTPRLYTELQREAARLLAAPVDFGLPALFIHGDADRVISCEGTRSYFQRSPLLRRELRLYPEARHELHNDPAHPEVFRDAFRFLAEHL